MAKAPACLVGGHAGHQAEVNRLRQNGRGPFLRLRNAERPRHKAVKACYGGHVHLPLCGPAHRQAQAFPCGQHLVQKGAGIRLCPHAEKGGHRVRGGKLRQGGQRPAQAAGGRRMHARRHRGAGLPHGQPCGGLFPGGRHAGSSLGSTSLSEKSSRSSVRFGL